MSTREKESLSFQLQISETKTKLTPKQLVTFLLIERLAVNIVDGNPDLEKVYRSDSNITFAGVAQRFIPDVFANNPHIAAAVVSRALHKLIPREELANLVSERQKNHFDYLRSINYYSSEEHRRRTILGGKQKALNTKRVPWSDEEKALVLALMEDPNFLHTAGRNKGRPNYRKITKEVNDRYHQGDEIRTPLITGDNARDWRTQAKN